MANDNGKAFAIHPDNLIGEYSRQDVPANAVAFATEIELAAISASWPASMLIQIWNRLPGVTPVSKFTDRKTAIRRIWKAVSEPSPLALRPAKGVRRKASQETLAQSKAGTKTEQIIGLLRRPEGATLKAIMAATGWQAHSVRGFISAQLTKKMGLKVKSFKRDGERVYRLRA